MKKNQQAIRVIQAQMLLTTKKEKWMKLVSKTFVNSSKIQIKSFYFVREEIENDEEEEEAEERSEIDEDEETQPFEMYDHHSMYGRHLSPSIPEIERDHEDILMIQYSNNAQNGGNANNNAENRENRAIRDRESQIGGNISISVTNNENNVNANDQPQNFLFNANFQQLLYNENSEQGGNENSNSAPGGTANATNEVANQPINTNAPPPNNHPLLSGRPDGAATDRLDDRLHVADGLQTARRSNRTRRYQFINISSRQQPVILQRMLELRHNRQAGTRVVVMDNGLSIIADDDHLDFEMVDQTGYWFGRTLANHLNNHPSALGWWQEENKISGPDSNSDLCMTICDEMIPELDAARQAELSKIRGKRKKKLEEEEAKQRNNQTEVKKTNEEDSAEIHVQPEVALSSALTNVPLPIEPIRVSEPQPAGNSIQVDLASVTSASGTSNNLNFSFVDAQQVQAAPITVTASVIPRQQQITTDQQLNLDMDFEMASDNEESSASANNSRSFSPNYSPNSNQIESGEMNMLNRETSIASEQQQAQPQVSNMNIQQQQQLGFDEDHPMADIDEDANETNMQIEASQVPLPTDDSDVDDTDSGDDTEDELEPTAAAAASESATTNESERVVSSENQAASNEEAGAVGLSESASAATTANFNEGEEEEEVATGYVQDMDPAIRAILGDLEVPEGVDPSFLAALPPEMRDEVIQEHIR
jgi:Ubiquitin binding region